MTASFAHIRGSPILATAVAATEPPAQIARSAPARVGVWLVVKRALDASHRTFHSPSRNEPLQSGKLVGGSGGPGRRGARGSMSWDRNCRLALGEQTPFAAQSRIAIVRRPLPVGSLEPDPEALGMQATPGRGSRIARHQRVPSDGSAFSRPAYCEVGVAQGGSFAADLLPR
jgi:hypothetical protein